MGLKCFWGCVILGSKKKGKGIAAFEATDADLRFQNLHVQYPGELKVNLWEHIGIITGLKYPNKVKGYLLY